jgi:DNA-directed RNA polymerase specialized sigma24 family protein
MYERSTEQTRELLDSLYRANSGRILATLIRLLGDFDLAEEAMHEAFAAVDFDGPIFRPIDTLRRRVGYRTVPQNTMQNTWIRLA